MAMEMTTLHKAYYDPLILCVESSQRDIEWALNDTEFELRIDRNGCHSFGGKWWVGVCLSMNGHSSSTASSEEQARVAHDYCSTESQYTIPRWEQLRNIRGKVWSWVFRTAARDTSVSMIFLAIQSGSVRLNWRFLRACEKLFFSVLRLNI